jgi:hypothetical protein
MAATASNTELPGTAVVIMRSLGPDWHHDKLVSVLWRTWFAASTQPILLRMGPRPLKVQPTLFWFVTLRFARCSYSTRSWVRRLPWMNTGASTGMLQPLTWRSTVLQALTESLLSHTRHNILYHFQGNEGSELSAHSSNVRTQNNNKYLRPKRWFKIRDIISLYHSPNRYKHICYIH